MKKSIFIILLLFLLSGCTQYNLSNDKGKTLDSTLQNNDIGDSEILEGRNETSQIRGENLKININVPEPVGFKPFEAEKYVNLSDFEFDNYFPMIAYEKHKFRKAPIYEYAIINNECKDLSNAEVLYQALNEKYNSKAGEVSTENPYSDTLKNIRYYLNRNRINWVSVDLSETIVSIIEHNNDSGFTNPTFDCTVKMYKNNEVIKTETLIENKDLFYVLDETGLYSDHHQDNYIDNTILEQLNFSRDVNILQTINEQWVVVEASLQVPDCDEDEKAYYEKSNNIDNGEVYLINIESFELKYLGNYMYNPVVSPDLKYVIYTEPHGEGSHEYFTETNKYEEIPKGFFIKNLETGETLFIPIQIITDDNYIGSHKLVTWISKDALKKMLEG